MITLPDGRRLGPGAPCLVIAEIGSNHDGDLGRALALVDAAAEAGADAVKFQSFRAATLCARRWPGPDGRWRPAPAFPVLERHEVPTAWHARLAEQAKARGVPFLPAAFDDATSRLLS